MGAGTKSNANILQLTTANNYTIKQDGSGFLGLYNISGTEVAYFDGHGVLWYLGSEAASNPTAMVGVGFESNNNLMFVVPSGNYGFDFYNGGNRVAKIGQNGFFITYGSTTLTGAGVPYQIAEAHLYAQTGNVSPITTVTLAAQGVVRIQIYVSATVASTGTTFTVSYTDHNAVAQTDPIPLANTTTGAMTPGTITTATRYYGTILIRATIATAITVQSSGYLSGTYDVETITEQVV